MLLIDELLIKNAPTTVVKGFLITMLSTYFLHFLTLEIFPNSFNERNFPKSSLMDRNHCKLTVIQNSSLWVIYHKVYLWKSRESLQGRILVQKNIWGKNFDFQEKYLPLIENFMSLQNFTHVSRIARLARIYVESPEQVVGCLSTLVLQIPS